MLKSNIIEQTRFLTMLPYYGLFPKSNDESYLNDKIQLMSSAQTINDVIVNLEDGNEIKIRELLKLYTKEFTNYSHYIKGFETVANEKVNKAIVAINKLEYETISLELTPDCSIVFRISFNNNVQKFYIALHFNGEKSEEESFFTYFVGDDCINNGMGSFDNVIADIKTIIKE